MFSLLQPKTGRYLFCLYVRDQDLEIIREEDFTPNSYWNLLLVDQEN